jgi:hypothetical protein
MNNDLKCEWLRDKWLDGKINMEEFREHIYSCRVCQTALCKVLSLVNIAVQNMTNNHFNN